MIEPLSWDSLKKSALELKDEGRDDGERFIYDVEFSRSVKVNIFYLIRVRDIIKKSYINLRFFRESLGIYDPDDMDLILVKTEDEGRLIDGSSVRLYPYISGEDGDTRARMCLRYDIL